MSNIIKFPSTEGIDQKLVQIESNLYQGSRGPAQDDNVLRQYGITQVLSITAVTLSPIRAACRWQLAVDDGFGWNEEQIGFVLRFCMFIEETGCGALIHCDHGASRSSGGVIIWKMLMENNLITKHQAYDWLRSVNPYANIRPEIFDSLPEKL